MQSSIFYYLDNKTGEHKLYLTKNDCIMMKKLLKFFVLVAFVGVFASCSNCDDNNLSFPEYMSEKKSSEVKFIQNYKSRSIMEYGCDVNGNMWTTKPALVTEQEVKEVLAYIKTKPDYCDALPNYTRYFIQHVGGAHNLYSYKDWNGAVHNGINGTTGFENLQILENSGQWVHVLNFNTGKCDNSATNNSALMTDGFNGIKALADYASSWAEAYRIYYYKGYYYIGLDFSAVKNDGVVPADGIYDDWVLKIIPEDGDNGDNGGDNGDDNSTVIGEGEVEFDIHQQEHKDWNEIKTTIHLRDSVNVRVLIPIPYEYIAIPDDFDIRAGLDFNDVITETEVVEYTVAGQTFEVEIVINHKMEGIEILIEGTQCKDALKVARAVYDDGLTFEIHNYVYNIVDPKTIWNWLKTTEYPQTSFEKWPTPGDCCTHTYGQIYSAYYQEGIEYDVKVEE